jgi:hypothetical protein
MGVFQDHRCIPVAAVRRGYVQEAKTTRRFWDNAPSSESKYSLFFGSSLEYIHRNTNWNAKFIDIKHCMANKREKIRRKEKVSKHFFVKAKQMQTH